MPNWNQFVNFHLIFVLLGKGPSVIRNKVCSKFIHFNTYFLSIFLYSQLMQELDEIKSSKDNKDDASQDTKKTSTKGYYLKIW